MALLELDDYVNRDVDPTAPFAPLSVHDELLDAQLLDPATVLPATLAPDLARARATSALRLQQHLVFRVGKQLGILGPAIPKVIEILKAVPMLSATAEGALIAEATSTVVGVAADALGGIPIVGWCIKAIEVGISLGLKIAYALETPGTYVGPSLPPASKYSTDADASFTNDRLLLQSDTRDWTSIFLPAMRGELAAQVRQDAAGRLVIAWGLRDDGVVPRIVIDQKPITKPYTWHFSESGGGQFTQAGGMGAVPGAAQIITVHQSTIQELQNIHRGHESLGDPRCGSDSKTIDVNVGSFYPTTASGAASLFGYCTKASASTYTIATQDVVTKWQAYVDAIWEGIEKLWRNPSWEGGWGCGPWQNALQGLAAAHCVGSDGMIGGFGSWMPTRYQTKLTAADRNAWEKNNLCTRVVKPAMMDLREMQLSLLRKTPIAAYLPAHGLGSFSDVSVKEEFEKARGVLIASPKRSEGLNLDDVVDPWYAKVLETHGKGTHGGKDGNGGIAPGSYVPPRIAMPGGGGGRGAVVLIGGAIALAGIGLAIRARRR